MPITTFSELENFLNKNVEIIGVYEEINGAKRPGAYSPSGRACILLEDGRHVALETQQAGIRPKEEMEQFSGKKVCVSGTYTGRQTLWGDGSQASIVSPCIMMIWEIKLV